MNKTLSIALGLVVLLTGIAPLSVSAQPVQQQPILDLFTEPAVPIHSRQAETNGEEVIRSRQVDVNTDILIDLARSSSDAGFSGQSVFMLNLFDDALYTADIDQVEEMADGSFGLVGRVNSTAYNELVMVVRDDILQAYLQDGPLAFEIRYTNGIHTIREVKSSLYPDSLTEPIPGAAPAANALSSADPLPIEADSAAVIDVLAVYTPAARSAVGGSSALETLIQASILSANSGYTASGVTQQVRLVGMEEVSYTENIPGATNANEWYAALERLTAGKSDAANGGVDDPDTANYLADARAYRESYKADLVFLVTDLPNVYCGLGWIAGYDWSDAYAYSVLHHNCIGSTSYSTQHEMGHNMGACHDRANSTTTCIYDYSYGYQKPDQFYTVMAYSNGCGDCYRINRWSNPNITYNGYPTGIDVSNPMSAYNALTLNNTAINVANYRDSGAPFTGNFTSPWTGSQAMQPRTVLDVDISSSAGSVVSVVYQAYYDGSWQSVHVDNDNTDGWEYIWPTAGITKQTIHLRAYVTDSLLNSTTIYVYNIPLSSTIVIGGLYESRGGDTHTPPSLDSITEEPTQPEVDELAPGQQARWQSQPY